MNNTTITLLQANIEAQLKGKYTAPMVLAGKPGLGKGHALSYPILTPEGFKPMGTLKKGDFVIGSDGEPTRILDVFPLGVRDIYSIKFIDETTVECTLDHIWTVRSRSKRKWHQITTEDLLKTELVKENYDSRYGTMQKEYTYSIPFNKPCKFSTKEKLPIHPYILGVLIGDGSLTNGVSFCNGNIDIVEKVKSLLPEHLEVSKNMRFAKGSYNCTIIAKKGYTNNYYHALKNLELLGKKSIKKHIPKQYLNASLEDRLVLYQGLVDTDGHKLKTGNIEYCTSSKQLIEDFKQLSLSLGKKLGTLQIKKNPAYEYKGEKKKSLNNSYRIVERRSRTIGKAIVGAELIGREEAQCIMVDAKDSLYIAGKGFNLTHNTTVIKKAAKDNNYHLVNVSIAALSVEELSGVPLFEKIEGFEQYSEFNHSKIRTTRWSVPEIVESANTLAKEKPTILLLDDLHELNMATQPYMLEFLLERKLGQFKLDKNVAIIATMNDSDEANFNGMSSPVRNRLAIYKVEFNFEHWFENIGKYYHFYISSFLKGHSSYVNEEESTGIEGFGTPRSYEFLSSTLQSLDRDFIIKNVQKIATQYISKNAAVALDKHIQYMESIDFTSKIKTKEKIDIKSLKVIDQVLYAYIVNYVETIDDAKYVIDLINSTDEETFIGFVLGELLVKYKQLTELKEPISDGVKAILNMIVQDEGLLDFNQSSKEDKEKVKELSFKDRDKIIKLAMEYII